MLPVKQSFQLPFRLLLRPSQVKSSLTRVIRLVFNPQLKAFLIIVFEICND